MIRFDAAAYTVAAHALDQALGRRLCFAGRVRFRLPRADVRLDLVLRIVARESADGERSIRRLVPVCVHCTTLTVAGPEPNDFDFDPLRRLLTDR